MSDLRKSANTGDSVQRLNDNLLNIMKKNQNGFEQNLESFKAEIFFALSEETTDETKEISSILFKLLSKKNKKSIPRIANYLKLVAEELEYQEALLSLSNAIKGLEPEEKGITFKMSANKKK